MGLAGGECDCKATSTCAANTGVSPQAVSLHLSCARLAPQTHQPRNKDPPHSSERQPWMFLDWRPGGRLGTGVSRSQIAALRSLPSVSLSHSAPPLRHRPAAPHVHRHHALRTCGTRSCGLPHVYRTHCAHCARHVLQPHCFSEPTPHPDMTLTGDAVIEEHADGHDWESALVDNTDKEAGNSRAAAPVPICESRRKTCFVFASVWLCRLSGRLVESKSGSPVFGSDWISMLPSGTSRITRLRPCENGPPERRIVMPMMDWCQLGSVSKCPSWMAREYIEGERMISYLLAVTHTDVLDTSRRTDLLWRVRKEVQCVLHDQCRETVRVEDELGARCTLITQDGHDTLASANEEDLGNSTHDELSCLRQEIDVLLGIKVVDDMVRMLRKVTAEAERACVELTMNVGYEQLDGSIVVRAGYNLTSARRPQEAHNVGVSRGRLHEVVVAVLHEAEVLVQDAQNVAAALGSVAANAAGEHEIRVAVLRSVWACPHRAYHKHLQVIQIPHLRVLQSHDTLPARQLAIRRSSKLPTQ